MLGFLLSCVSPSPQVHVEKRMDTLAVWGPSPWGYVISHKARTNHCDTFHITTQWNAIRVKSQSWLILNKMHTRKCGFITGHDWKFLFMSCIFNKLYLLYLFDQRYQLKNVNSLCFSLTLYIYPRHNIKWGLFVIYIYISSPIIFFCMTGQIWWSVFLLVFSKIVP